jgi:hypothetical protein
MRPVHSRSTRKNLRPKIRTIFPPLKGILDGYFPVILGIGLIRSQRSRQHKVRLPIDWVNME